MLIVNPKRKYVIKATYPDGSYDHWYLKSARGAEDRLLVVARDANVIHAELHHFVRYPHSTNLFARELVGTFIPWDVEGMRAIIRTLHAIRLAEMFGIEEEEWRIA